MVAGLSFGVSLVTKENAIFFAPALGYLVYRQAKGLRNRRFVTSFWWIAAGGTGGRCTSCSPCSRTSCSRVV